MYTALAQDAKDVFLAEAYPVTTTHQNEGHGQMERGICKLCFLEKDLRESHYLPRSAYKSNRARALKNQNPVVLGSKLKQDQSQVTDYVFCTDCEQRLSRNGESWVLARIPHDYGEPFGLQDSLENETPFSTESGLNLYAGRASAPSTWISSFISQRAYSGAALCMGGKACAGSAHRRST